MCFLTLLLLTLFTGDPIKPISFADLKKNFAQPGKEYGSAPLWVWHTKITRPIIDSMMVEFKRNAFGGVMVHPRPGLITEYLSKEWYELFKYTVSKGKQLGLNVWIYDENSYPTGFAGGLVPDQMPESYNQGQMLTLTKTDSGGYSFKKAYYQKQSHMVSPPDYPYVDLLVKGVTSTFIDVTFKGYEKAVGAEFGKTVPGIFSDEPSIPSHIAGAIRWTPDLFSTFQKNWGYDLQTNLLSLFEEVGDWRKVRHNYQHTLLQLFIDRWSKPMYNYAEQHHLKWTGHYWEHGWPDPGEGPDNMAMYAWHQQPGIDMLFNQFNETSANAQFGNIRAVKELGSVANQLNKQRTLCETYGGGGWELTFKDMKRLADWQYVLGVNFLNQHLSMMTLTGVRKYDYPQSFSYHAPWWNYYKPLNQYYARLSYALSQGEQRNELLVIEPTTSAWMYSLHGKPNPRLHAIGQAFQSFVTRLEKAQVEYDLGSENIVKDHGKITAGKFVVGSRAYTTVVIPPGMENIDRPTFILLKSFVEQGGKLLQFEQLQRIDGAESGELQSVNKGTMDKEFAVANGVYHQRRMLSDGQLLFLANSSMDSAVNVNIPSHGKDVLLMDLFTGEIFLYPATIVQVPPAGSVLLFIADTKQTGYKKYRLPENPWDHQMQFKDRIIARDTFSRGSGFTVTYHFTIDSVNFDRFKAVIEQPLLWKKITINGRAVQPLKGQWWLDRSFGVLNIGPYLKAGRNSLSIAIDPMSVYAEIEPVYILGNFNVTPAVTGWQLTAPKPLQLGSWKEQGLPLYGHSVTYVKECVVIGGENISVQLGAWKGTVASVKVNGISAGIIIDKEPLAIARYLKEGNNKIEVTITGSLKNLLGPHHNNPRPGMVGPGHWSNVRRYPSGNEYQLYDYGLLEDFKVVKH